MKKVWKTPMISQLNVSETEAKGGGGKGGGGGRKNRGGTEARRCRGVTFDRKARVTSCS